MRRFQIGLAVVAAVAGATPSEACRDFRAAPERLAGAHRANRISAVAAVRIVAAHHTQPPDGDVHPWRASARIERVVRGAPAGPTVSFERGWGSSACQETYPLPVAGEEWVLYFSRRHDGSSRCGPPILRPWPFQRIRCSRAGDGRLPAGRLFRAG